MQPILKRYARTPQSADAIYGRVAPEARGNWLAEQKATEHYAALAASRIEAMYDSLRQRCQKLDPAFFFGMAPQLNHLPGVVRGLGTASVPSLSFGEHEYHHGAYRWSFIGTKRCREHLPALFLCGAWIAVQPPEMLANNVLQSSLYTDGWWAYYGTALLTDVGAAKEPWIGYGRVLGTTARDYLDRIAAAHTKLDKLLTLPKSQWPARQDGKLNWLKAKVDKAEAAVAKTKSTETDKALAEAKANLAKYMGYMRTDD